MLTDVRVHKQLEASPSGCSSLKDFGRADMLATLALMDQNVCLRARKGPAKYQACDSTACCSLHGPAADVALPSSSAACKVDDFLFDAELWQGSLSWLSFTPFQFSPNTLVSPQSFTENLPTEQAG